LKRPGGRSVPARPRVVLLAIAALWLLALASLLRFC
jgi:hypothetical protein